MTSKAAIVLDNLSKRYGNNKNYAVNKLSITIDHGEVYGFLGSNGAGKSTTIRILMNFLLATGGSATILGKDSKNDSVALKKQIGYLAGDVALYQKSTGEQLLDYLAKLHGNVQPKYRANLEKRFEVQTDKKIHELSKGNRQKIGIVQAFMHQPDILILDEPTSGLDPLMQERFYETIAEAKERGAAVFLSSHNLTEAQRVCDRIGIIKDGTLVREEIVGASSKLQQPILIVTVKNEKDITLAKSAKSITIFSTSGKTFHAHVKTNINEALVAISQIQITDISIQKPSLEDDFMTFYGDEA